MLPFPYDDPARTIRIGHIMPSSNSWAEPLTYALNRELDGRVSHHFSRIPVLRLGLDGQADAQFQDNTMVEAAKLLADAPLNAIVWNGTSASWRGLEQDLALCAAITKATGLPAVTATTGMYGVYRRHGWKKIGLALPYLEDVSRQLAQEYARQGYEVTENAFLDISANVEIGATKQDRMRDLLRAAARGKPDCIAVVCTNFPATALVAEMEAELGIPIVDSIAVTFLEACLAAGVTPRITGWGHIFDTL